MILILFKKGVYYLKDSNNDKIIIVISIDKTLCARHYAWSTSFI